MASDTEIVRFVRGMQSQLRLSEHTMLVVSGQQARLALAETMDRLSEVGLRATMGPGGAPVFSELG